MDWLPGATKSPMHETGFDWQTSCPMKIVLHTTEGAGFPAYPSQYEPQLTVKPIPGKGVEVHQHIAFNQASYALKHTGAAPTNGAHAIQIELVGTCDPDPTSDAQRAGAYFWPHADDVVLKALWDQVLKPLCDAFKVPLHAPAFTPYPASYGNTSVRFNDQQWLAFSGICGHQHVPGNDHGDPGGFPFARLVALAGQTPKPPKPGVATIYGPLRYGDNDSHTHGSVRPVQHKLGVDADGIFGRQTLIAVQAWQKKRSLTQDGVVGPATAKSLGFAYTAR